jgi:hypothetical protein
MPPARARMLLLMVWAAAMLPVAWAAGCRRVRAKVTHEQQFFNHQPTPKWHLHDLPANFSWNDVNGTGRSLLVRGFGHELSLSLLPCTMPQAEAAGLVYFKAPIPSKTAEAHS